MPKRTKKIGRPPIEESWVYVIEIRDWEMPYHFSVNRNKKAMDGPFQEHIDWQKEFLPFRPSRVIYIDSSNMLSSFAL